LKYRNILLRSVLLLVRPWRRSGSLRDFLFHCNPENSFKEK